LTYSIPISIKLTAKGAESSLDFAAYKIPQGGHLTYYVDSRTGDDSQPGVSWGTAKKSLKSAVDAADTSRAVVYVRGRWVFYPGSLFGASAKNSISIIGVPDENQETPILVLGDTLSWEKLPGRDSIWYALIGPTQYASTSLHLLDYTLPPAFYGSPPPAERLIGAQNTFDTLDIKPNAYIVNAARDTIFYRPARGTGIQGPQDSIFFFRHSRHGSFRAPGDYYFENLEFWGGGGVNTEEDSTAQNRRLDTRRLHRFFFKNCAFKYTGSSTSFSYRGGLTGIVNDSTEMYLEDCLAAWSVTDGFNYHHADVDANDKGGKIYENRCVGKYNGFNSDYTGFPSGSNNGSTTHEKIIGIRLNGLYFDTGGRPLHDIENSKTWLVNCTAYSSLITSGAEAIMMQNAFSRADFCRVPIALNNSNNTFSGVGNLSAFEVRWCYRGWTSTPSLGNNSGITILR
jgi:hypothetical protein